MVKHQRRSHQPGGAIVDDSDESGDESPSTPRAASMWPQPHGMMHHNGMSMQRFTGQYIQPFPHRHSVSSNGTSDYTHSMHHEMPMMRRLSSQQHQQLYVADGPGVQTMAPSYSQVPRHASISYTEAGMTASLNSSPSAYSSGSVRSPGVEGGYTFQPAQAATQALHSADHQPHTMGHYPASTQPLMSMPTQHAHGHHPSMTNHGVYHQQLATSGPVSSTYDNPNLVAMQDPTAMNFYLPIENGFKVEEHMMLPGQRISMESGIM